MKKTFLAITLLLLVAGMASAQKKGAKKAAPAQPAAAAPAKTATPDTVDLKTFSYMVGMAQTNGLKPWLQNQQGLDTLQMMDDFVKGFMEYANNIDDPKTKAYRVGMDIADQVINQMYKSANRHITDNPDSAFISKEDFLKGFVASITTGNPTISQDSALNQTERQLNYYHGLLMEKKYGANRQAGIDFLAANAKKDSVVTLPSGLQYKVITAGTGEKPKATDRVEVNYEGRLIDGTVFDSSYKRNKPQEFGVSGVVKGFSEALQNMPVGSTWEVYIPQELAYGDAERQGSPIQPYSTLIFKIELLSIKAAPQPKVPGKTLPAAKK